MSGVGGCHWCLVEVEWLLSKRFPLCVRVCVCVHTLGYTCLLDLARGNRIFLEFSVIIFLFFSSLLVDGSRLEASAEPCLVCLLCNKKSQ